MPETLAIAPSCTAHFDPMGFDGRWPALKIDQTDLCLVDDMTDTFDGAWTMQLVPHYPDKCVADCLTLLQAARTCGPVAGWCRGKMMLAQPSKIPSEWADGRIILLMANSWSTRGQVGDYIMRLQHSQDKWGFKMTPWDGVLQRIYYIAYAYPRLPIHTIEATLIDSDLIERTVPLDRASPLVVAYDTARASADGTSIALEPLLGPLVGLSGGRILTSLDWHATEASRDGGYPGRYEMLQLLAQPEMIPGWWKPFRVYFVGTGFQSKERDNSFKSGHFIHFRNFRWECQATIFSTGALAPTNMIARYA